MANTKQYKQKSLEELVDIFALSVMAQRGLMFSNAKKGNVYANAYIEAWNELRQRGDVGRESLKKLLSHEQDCVRSMAAAFLLKYANKEATKVLKEIAKGDDFDAFASQQALDRWREGDWHLDED